MKYRLSLIISVIILLLVVFNLPTKEEKELKTDTLIAYIDGRKTNTIPTKSKDIKVDRIVCDNNADAEWDDANWGIYISDITNNSTKCSVYFKTFPAPELYQGLIPVTYDASGNTVVADTTTDWYDYDNHIWANAVLGTSTARAKTAGQTLSDSEILQYYVWIPRYRYQLFNATPSGISDEQMINIEFENKNKLKSNGTTNGQWLTHPAFTFGTTELNGIWVGKFESSHSNTSEYIDQSTKDNLNCSNESCSAAAGLIIKPNVVSIVNNRVSQYFFASRSIESQNVFGLNSNQVDTHMMKNMEWGAVTYLSSSKYGLYETVNTCHNADSNISVTINGSSVNRCDVWINNTRTGTGNSSDPGVTRYGGTITGCSAKNSIKDNGQISMTNCGGSQYEWNGTSNNGRSSTSGNIYGIYDLVGGSWELIMGNQSSSTTEFVWNPQGSGFSAQPDTKYFDRYLASTYNETEEQENLDFTRGLLGDATREVLKTNDNRGSWFSNRSLFYTRENPWLRRGGNNGDQTYTGLFNYNANSGSSNTTSSFRVVLTEQ